MLSALSLLIVIRCLAQVFGMGGAVLVMFLASFSNAIAREKYIKKVAQMRPYNLVILDRRSDFRGQYLLGIYDLNRDSSDREVKRFKLWQELPNDLKVHSEFVRCSTTDPLRVKRDTKLIYVRRLNPGGVVTKANREDHLVWWAACFPDFAATTPKTMHKTALKLGYSTQLIESLEVLSSSGR